MPLPKRLTRFTLQILAWLSALGFLYVIYLLGIGRDSLPLAIHRNIPLLPKAPVVLDLIIEDCYFNYRCRQTNADGWYRHPKDLQLGGSRIKSTYLFTKRVPEESLSVKDHTLINIAIASSDTTVPEEVLGDLITAGLEVDDTDYQSLQAAALSLGWSVRSQKYGVWVKHGPFDPSKSITGIKILFGDSAVYPVPNWHLLRKGLRNLAKEAPPRIAYRIGARQAVEKPVLNVNKGSNLFKIVQLSDLHMAEGDEPCDNPTEVEIDEDGNPLPCWADKETLKFVTSVLDKEMPDMVVFSGDQIRGWVLKDPETALAKALAPVIERKIPYALIFGNHDSEGSLSNEELLALMADMPYSMTEAGPSDVTGVGNYVLSAHVNGHAALSMYFLDSHGRRKKSSYYQEIDSSQHNWLREAGKVVKEEQSHYSKLPISMAFIHIPLPEFDNNYLLVGAGLESVMSAKYDNNTIDVLREIGVSIVSSGHDHCNDFCKFADDPDKANIWLCYGGGSGYGGYGGYVESNGKLYERRIRVYEFDSQRSSISTWKRVANQEQVIDFHYLVTEGKATL